MNKYPREAAAHSLGAYIPELYAKELLVHFYTRTVLSAIANTDYEGEIKNMGDTVKIRGLPTVEIKDYKVGTELAYEYMQPPNVDLEINKGKYFAMNAPDVDQVQSDITFLTRWADHASESLKIAVDRDCLGRLPATAHAKNQGQTAGKISGNIDLGATGHPVTITNKNVLTKLLQCVQALQEQDVDTTNPANLWAVIPAWMATMIQTSVLKDASLAGDGTSMLRNGRLGIIGNLTLYQSNNLTKDSDSNWHILVGHKAGYTFASQLLKSETLKNPKDFGDLLRGLQVYGDKVVKPEAVAVLYAKEGQIQD